MLVVKGVTTGGAAAPPAVEYAADVVVDIPTSVAVIPAGPGRQRVVADEQLEVTVEWEEPSLTVLPAIT